MVAEAEGFHSVIDLPDEYWVFDFTRGEDKTWVCPYDYQIGRYDEYRPNVYTTDLFEGIRNIHVGIDIGGPGGTPCMAFTDGEVSHFGYNPEPGDYGNVLITKHKLDGVSLWALYGHLSSESIENKILGQKVVAGEVVAWFGDESENGGWEPHLHFQLSLIEPETHDMPGVVAPEDREQALNDYPDPRLVLGPLY